MKQLSQGNFDEQLDYEDISNRENKIWNTTKMMRGRRRFVKGENNMSWLRLMTDQNTPNDA